MVKFSPSEIAQLPVIVCIHCHGVKVINDSIKETEELLERIINDKIPQAQAKASVPKPLEGRWRNYAFINIRRNAINAFATTFLSEYQNRDKYKGIVSRKMNTMLTFTISTKQAMEVA